MSVLSDQGMQANQQIIFLSDGADNVRALQYNMYPESEHVLDWFHITMRLTVLNQFAKGLENADQDAGAMVGCWGHPRQMLHLTSKSLIFSF